ncbi:hypothetical protein OAU52_00665 [bacterium]|nr:hypothetical protein [bacterium]
MKINLFLILTVMSLSNAFALIELKGLNYKCTQKRCELDLTFSGSKLPAYKLTKGSQSGMVFKNLSIASDTNYSLSKKSYLKSLGLNKIGNNLSISLQCKEACVPFSKIEKIKNGVRFVLEGKFKSQKKRSLKLPKVNVAKKNIAKSSSDKKATIKKIKSEPQKKKLIKKQKVVKQVKKPVKKVTQKSIVKRDTIAVMSEFISKDSMDYLKFKAEVAKSKPDFSTKKSYSFQKQERKLISITSTYLYTSPNLMSEKLEPISVGHKMTLLSRHGIWVKVLHGRIKGFIPEAELAYEDELLEGQREKIEQYILLRLRKDSVAELSPKIPPYFIYSSFGKRDPFLPIDLPEIDGISMDELRLVAIIWDSKEPMAILQDVRSEDVSYNLQEGDRVINGTLSKILPNEVIFTLTEFGVTRNFSMILPHLTEAR